MIMRKLILFFIVAALPFVCVNAEETDEISSPEAEASVSGNGSLISLYTNAVLPESLIWDVINSIDANGCSDEVTSCTMSPYSSDLSGYTYVY